MLTYKSWDQGSYLGLRWCGRALLPCGCGSELGFADGLAVAAPVNDFLFPALPCICSAVKELHTRKKKYNRLTARGAWDFGCLVFLLTAQTGRLVICASNTNYWC